MSDLTFKGFPTTPEQRAYFESLDLEFYKHGDTGPYQWEKWAVTWTKAYVTEAEPEPDYVLIRWCPAASLEKSEVVYHGRCGSRTLNLVQWALFPNAAANELGIRIYHMVMGNEELLGFNLNKVTGTEIVEALRALAKSKELPKCSKCKDTGLVPIPSPPPPAKMCGRWSEACTCPAAWWLTKDSKEVSPVDTQGGLPQAD